MIMFWPFSTIKKLRQENAELKAMLNKPLSLGPPLSADEWGELSEDEQVDRFRKLELVLTLKKTGRWDYKNDCADL